MDIETLISENAKIIDNQLKKQILEYYSKEDISKLIGKQIYDYDERAFSLSLIDPLWYILNLGGKRWRPTLMMLFLEAFGQKKEEYMPFLILPEIIHNATLVHDDLEDNSDTRRGAPAVHIKFGIDIATNLGDFMLFFPTLLLLKNSKISNEKKLNLIDSYLENMVRVTVGQGTDISWHAGLIPPEKISEANYLQMSNDKTGVLARFSCELAGILGGMDKQTIKKIGNFGASIGIAFQIQDDILNIDESSVSKSKGGIGDDISEGKITLLVIRAMQIGSDTDKQRLLKILSEHTKDKEKIKEAIKILIKYDTINYSKKIAEKIVSESWDEIENILPENKAKEQLKQFAEFMIKRTK